MDDDIEEGDALVVIDDNEASYTCKRSELWAAIVRLQSATDWRRAAHGGGGTEEQLRLREREVRALLGLDAPA